MVILRVPGEGRDRQPVSRVRQERERVVVHLRGYQNASPARSYTHTRSNFQEKAKACSCRVQRILLSEQIRTTWVIQLPFRGPCVQIWVSMLLDAA